jgi:hypothetical protein
LEKLYYTDELKDWLDAARATSEAKYRLTTSESFLTQMARDGWEAWKRRMASGEFAHDDPNLLAALTVCHFANIGPARFLQADIRRMTLLQWSNAFLAGVYRTADETPPACPRWLIWPAARTLGWKFSTRDGQALAERLQTLEGKGAEPVDAKEIEMMALTATTSTEWAVMIVAQEKESYLEQWSPSDRVRAVLLTRTDVERLLGYFQKHSLTPLVARLVRFDLLVVEEPKGEKDLQEYARIFDPLARESKRLEAIGLFAKPQSQPSVSRYVVAPKNLDDLVEQSTRTSRRKAMK